MTLEFWEGLTGSTVCGKYPLRRFIGSTGRSATYLTSHGLGGVNAVLKLAPPFEGRVDPPRIEHAHILQLLDSGLCEIGERNFRYLVIEAWDEDLATAVSGRPLSPDETRLMLEPVLEALAYLHYRGMAHGEINLKTILKVGDSYKLSVESIRPEGTVASAAKDMWALGLAIIEAMTQTRQLSATVALPQPFRDIVEGSLRLDPATQWTTRTAAARLSGPAVGPVAPTTSATTSAEGRRAPGMWPSAKQIGVYAGAAVLLLAVSGVVVRRSGSPPRPSPGAAAVTRPVAVAPPPEVNSPNAKPQLPTIPAPSASLSAANSPKVEQPSGEGHVVVVGSFSSQENALHQAELIARKWPEFKPRVSPPSDADGYYLVVIGSPASAEDAQFLRERAVASGLAKDAYIK